MTIENHRVRKVWVGVKINPDGNEEFIAIRNPSNPLDVIPMVTSNEDTAMGLFKQVIDKVVETEGCTIELREFYDYETFYKKGPH